MQSLQKPRFHLSTRHAFGRLFPELKPLFLSDGELEDLADQMLERTTCLDSTSISNGQAIFGQFLAHDVTFEVSSKFKGSNRSETFVNDRSYSLDLDCLYGQWTQDFLYDKDDRDKLLLGERWQDDCERVWYDLQRNAQCKAIIPDARNDENIIVSRMQVLFIQFHNCMVDLVKRDCKNVDVFQEARRRTIWCYHWLIVHEYLEKLLDPTIFAQLNSQGPRFYCEPWFLPLEFTGAAFRIGHSQTREDNRINETTTKNLFELGMFERMEDYVDWRYLFDFEDGKVQPAKQLDTKIGRIFHDLPFIKSKDKNQRSLVFRNLKRGVIYELPSGEDVAKRLCIAPLDIRETKDLDGTPLWYYILKEAEVLGQSQHLGPVGSRLLGEVFFTLMDHDNWSYRKVHPKWQPKIGAQEGTFTFADLVNFVARNA